MANTSAELTGSRTSTASCVRAPGCYSKAGGLLMRWSCPNQSAAASSAKDQQSDAAHALVGEHVELPRALAGFDAAARYRELPTSLSNARQIQGALLGLTDLADL